MAVNHKLHVPLPSRAGIFFRCFGKCTFLLGRKPGESQPALRFLPSGLIVLQSEPGDSCFLCRPSRWLFTGRQGQQTGTSELHSGQSLPVLSVTVPLTDNIKGLSLYYYFFNLTVVRQVFKSETKHTNFWTDCTVLVTSDTAGACEAPQHGFPSPQYRYTKLSGSPARERVCVSHGWSLGAGLNTVCPLTPVVLRRHVGAVILTFVFCLFFMSNLALEYGMPLLSFISFFIRSVFFFLGSVFIALSGL